MAADSTMLRITNFLIALSYGDIRHMLQSNCAELTLASSINDHLPSGHTWHSWYIVHNERDLFHAWNDHSFASSASVRQ